MILPRKGSKHQQGHQQAGGVAVTTAQGRGDREGPLCTTKGLSQCRDHTGGAGEGLRSQAIKREDMWITANLPCIKPLCLTIKEKRKRGKKKKKKHFKQKFHLKQRRDRQISIPK